MLNVFFDEFLLFFWKRFWSSRKESKTHDNMLVVQRCGRKNVGLSTKIIIWFMNRDWDEKWSFPCLLRLKLSMAVNRWHSTLLRRGTLVNINDHRLFFLTFYDSSEFNVFFCLGLRTQELFGLRTRRNRHSKVRFWCQNLSWTIITKGITSSIKSNYL